MAFRVWRYVVASIRSASKNAGGLLALLWVLLGTLGVSVSLTHELHVLICASELEDFWIWKETSTHAAQHSESVSGKRCWCASNTRK
jgi:hypothetical protein